MKFKRGWKKRTGEEGGRVSIKVEKRRSKLKRSSGGKGSFMVKSVISEKTTQKNGGFK